MQNNNMQLQNFVVTGATSGIGFSITQHLLQLGASVVGIGRNEDKLMDIKNSNPNFNYEIRDLSLDIDSLSELIDLIVINHGKLDGIVLCAGIQDTLPIGSIKYEKAKKLFDINYFSNLMLIKGFSKKKNHNSASSIVIISSITSSVGLPGISNYSASKAALIGLSKSLAIELSKEHIRINCVSPGHVKTDMLSKARHLGDDFLSKIEHRYPLGLGNTEDIANVVEFLLSDKSKWITGSNIILDGGLSINF